MSEIDKLSEEWETSVRRESSYDIYSGKKAIKRYEKLEKEYGKGTSTGYSQLNNYFKFLPGQIYLLSAPTHHGKTMLALNVCSYVSVLNKKVLFVSLEQGIFVVKFVKGLLGHFPKTLSILDTSQMLSVSELQEILRYSEKYDLICIDHIHFLKRKGKGATEDVDETIHELQNLSKDIQTPILAISHLRKLNKSKYPTLDDLKDAVALSQVPSVVVLLQRKEDKNGLSDEGVLYIKKNRIQGKTGALKFKIYEKYKIVFKNDIVQDVEEIFNG